MSPMEHDQFEILIASILTAGQLGSQKADSSDPAGLLAKTLEKLRDSQIIVKKNASFIPKGR